MKDVPRILIRALLLLVTGLTGVLLGLFRGPLALHNAKKGKRHDSANESWENGEGSSRAKTLQSEHARQKSETDPAVSRAD